MRKHTIVTDIREPYLYPENPLTQAVNENAWSKAMERLQKERAAMMARAALTGLTLTGAAILSALSARWLPEVLAWGLALVAGACAAWQFRAAVTLYGWLYPRRKRREERKEAEDNA